MTDLIGSKKAPEKVEKPTTVKIIAFQPLATPGAVQGAINVMIMGLGDDSKMYSWDPAGHKWYE